MTASTKNPIPFGIPRERINYYESFEGEASKFEAASYAIDMIRRDVEALRRAGRSKAAAGAANILSNLVRRYCIILATSSEEVAQKIEELDALVDFYEEEGQPLMAAMVEFAGDFERQRWSAS